MSKEEKSIILTWKIMDTIIQKAVKQIVNSEMPDVIVAIQRGGFIPAVILSHALNIREIVPLNIKVTSDDAVNSPKMQPVIERNIEVQKIKEKKVLLVDDIIGSGVTYRAAINYLQECQPASISSFICVINKNNWEKDNDVTPSKFIDCIGMEVRGWVQFPWEGWRECTK